MLQILIDVGIVTGHGTDKGLVNIRSVLFIARMAWFKDLIQILRCSILPYCIDKALNMNEPSQPTWVASKKSVGNVNLKHTVVESPFLLA